MSDTMNAAHEDGSDTIIALTGQDWNKIVEAAREAANPASGSSSTWDHSTHRRMACCG